MIKHAYPHNMEENHLNKLIGNYGITESDINGNKVLRKARKAGQDR